MIFLHAPSVYDFREESILFGPISDVVPSSSTFEMYPVGITSIADMLERNGFNVQIINIAYLMLHNPKLDVEKLISNMDSQAFAIDLHWLPHAHGSIEIAKLVKKYHPDAPIIMGGLSSSYFHEELISYPFVDYVVRGDSTEEPVRQLIVALTDKKPLDNIPNLTWKKPDGTVVVNPLSFVPDNLDYAMVPSYKYVIKSVFKYFSLHNNVPYLEWLNYPTTALLTARGCTQNCSVCGGSQFAYNRVCNRPAPAFRSPKTLVEDVKLITSFSQAPIFILHDIRQAGKAYAEEFFTLLKKENISNELIIELFYPADEAYFLLISECVPKFSLEITLETHDPELRKLNGKFKCSNAEVEATIGAALKYSCRKIDIFFMAGIPKQTYASVMESMDYCQHLLETFNGDHRLALFVAPLAPFLDPGCLAYENPEKYGYTKFCNTLEEHRKALVQPSWKYILSYETDCMTRDQIVKSTYEAATRLNQIKFMYGLIKEDVYEDIKFRITKSLETLDEIDQIVLIPDELERKAAMDELKEKVRDLNNATICGEDELKWPIHKRFSNTFSVAKLVGGLFLEEAVWVVRKVLGLKRPEVSPFLTKNETSPEGK